VQIRLDATCIPDLDILNPSPHREDFDPKFMARDTWEREKRKFPEITTDVGPAYTHPMCSD
jgi:hypothetical protein